MAQQLLVTAVLSLAQMALAATRKIEGPRLDDRKVTDGDYGASLPMVWGTRRIQCPIFWAEDLREVKRRRKTKGGKFNEYSYFGTFAVAIAGHEISNIRRIWFDSHLIYDLTGSGPVTPFDFGSSGGDVSSYITIYTGTETQEIDPRMDAWATERYGEGSCPAYRGTAYIAFKDIPLEKLGNRLPQVSVEVAGEPTYPLETITLASPTQTSGLQFAPDFATMAMGFSSFAVVDVAARAEMLNGTYSPTVENSTSGIGFLESGNIVAIRESDNDPYLYDLAGSGTLITNVGSTQMSIVQANDANGIGHWVSTQLFTISEATVDGTFYDLLALTGTDWYPTGLACGLDGSLWIVGKSYGSGVDNRYFCAYRISGGAPTFLKVEMPTSDAPGGAVCYQGDGLDLIIFESDGVLYSVDVGTNAIIASTSDFTYSPSFTNFKCGSPTIWCGFTEIRLSDLTTLRTLNKQDWDGSFLTDGPTIYDPVNHALLTKGVTTLSWYFLDRLGTSSTTLGAIAADVAGYCGITDYDFTDLDQAIAGYSATRGDGTSILEPLFDAYDSDIGTHDFGIVGKKRHGVTSGGTLETAYFVADGNPRHTSGRRQSTELPRAIIIDFADLNGDQQPNSKRADRPISTTDAKGEKKYNLTTLAITPDEANELGNRVLRRVWGERVEAGFTLLPNELALEPGDVREAELDGVIISVRCISQTIKPTGELETKWKFDHPSLALLDGSGGAGFDGRDEETVAVPTISKGIILDVPYLSDVDDRSTPALYFLGAPYSDLAWPGCVFYREVDGAYETEEATLTSDLRASWGTATDVLGDANPNLWDRGSSVNISLNVGTLSGTTEAAINASRTLNLAAIGAPGRWELVQFTTATLEMDGTYTLSGFRRGRRGTEHNTGNHAIGDTFVLLEDALISNLGLSDVGLAINFKAITNGRTEAGAFPISVDTFTAATLKPYAPVHLEGTKDGGTGDWSLSWVRRTRIGGDWVSGTSTPLSEVAEEYEVDIMNGGTVVRTITVTSAAATYTDAQQVADFGSTQGSLTWRVYQMSDAVGRGFVAETTS